MGATKENMDFLSRAPYNIARFGQGGVKELILAQWGEVEPHMHSPVTRHILQGQLGQDFRNATEEGPTTWSPVVAYQRRALADTPLDDSYAEGPHAAATRASSRSRRARMPWRSSTMRVSQNIGDARAFA